MSYIKRLSDEELNLKLESAGALLIRGPKACGKTASAMQFAKSVLRVDQDDQVSLVMSTKPEILLRGETPRLIDEWQLQPRLWNYVRHAVDDRKKESQFILTGSANPVESQRLHSGAGRFTVMDMRTMSWQELGYSTGKISMSDLFQGRPIDIYDEGADLEFIIEKMVIGGFPTNIGKSLRHAREVNRAYIDLLAEVDMSRVSNIKRDPMKVRSLLRSLARNVATTVDITSLEKDIRQNESNKVSRPTIYDYLDTLERLMIIEDQPAWGPNIRSAATLRQNPKRHFADVSLPIAALSLTPRSLINDLKYTGFLFETLVTHDLRIYAQANDAIVYHYRDSNRLEVDAIVQRYDGEWMAFEVKLGIGQIEEAAEHLKKFAQIVDIKSKKHPTALNIITGTGRSYARNDGVNVISLASLGK